MKIAILAHSFINWSGGRDFLSSIIQALHVASLKQPLVIYLIIPHNPGLADAEIGPTVDWIQRHGANTIIKGYKHTSISDILECLDRVEADVVIPSMLSLGERFRYPWVGYLYDFQHKFYPELFSKHEIEAREQFFLQMLTEAKAVIVNSRAVKEDIHKYYPQLTCRVFDLPFSPSPDISWFNGETDVKQKYSLPERYFAICNQFWVHKDHGTAFEALAIIKQKLNIEAAVICTGNTYDHRFPDHIAKLSEQIQQSNLQSNIRILGQIPKQDQLQLMRNAIAVIQPTLFEGGPGGGSVREAVALGIPVIVSDIPVNQEIGDSNVLFFKAGSAVDLAEKMEFVWKQQPLNPLPKEVLLERGKAYDEIKSAKLLEAISCVRNQILP